MNRSTKNLKRAWNFLKAFEAAGEGYPGQSLSFKDWVRLQIKYGTLFSLSCRAWSDRKATS